MRKHLVFLLLLLLLLPLSLRAQDGETTETAPADTAGAAEAETTAVPESGARYYNERTRIGAPIPEGWEDTSTGDVARFSRGNFDIFIIRVEAETAEAGIIAGLEQIIAGFDTSPQSTGTVNLANGTWTQQVYQPDDITTITALGQVYDGDDYVIAFLDRDPDLQVQMLIVPGDDPQAVAAIRQAFDPAFDRAPDSSTPLGENAVLNSYRLDDGSMLMVQAQVRGGFTLVALERGAAGSVPQVGGAFYEVLLGFFVTPENLSYLLLGLVAITLIVGLFVASLILRYRSAQQDLRLVAALRADES